MRIIDADALEKDIEMAVEDAPLHIQATVQQYIDCAPTIDLPSSPCDCCIYDPPSSLDGKPCTMCPAMPKEV